jgi:hypothetical protein
MKKQLFAAAIAALACVAAQADTIAKVKGSGVITMGVITVGVIMAMGMAMSKDGKLDDVEEETSPSSDHHEVFLDLRRVENSQGGLIKQPNCQTP